jgi:hypothetical protein
VIIIAGADWSPIIPYYAERKALLIRRGLENDEAYLARAFDDLAGEDISALVLTGDQRTNHLLAQRIAARFDLDPGITYSHSTADVYVARFYHDTVVDWLNRPHGFEQISTTHHPAAETPGLTPTPVSPEVGRTLFSMVTPAPSQIQATHGMPLLEFEGGHVLSSHPDSDLWIQAPAHARHIECEFGLLPGAYTGESKTNGVEFIVIGQRPDGTTRELFRRVLDPADKPEDRGVQTVVLDYRPDVDELVLFRTRDNGHPAFDWAFPCRVPPPQHPACCFRPSAPPCSPGCSSCAGPRWMRHSGTSTKPSMPPSPAPSSTAAHSTAMPSTSAHRSLTGC